jgi:penicillin amidase
MLNKVFSRIIYLILGLAFAIIIIIYGIVHISKPSNDGKVVVDEILEKVSIQKDQWGIPHIEAKNQHDALFAYGYTVAKDRFVSNGYSKKIS